MKDENSIRNYVREKYSQIVKTDGADYCAPNCCTGKADYNAVSVALGYTEDDVNQVPEGFNLGLGCGNPQAIAAIKKGETVLDLGSGGGFDAFLAAKQVDENGKVIGVDMTPEMIDRARENAIKAGIKQVEFRLGEIEHLPVADNTIDVIISNCVINLSPEKQKVFNESYRVLKPGGRLAISDVVATGELPETIKKDLSMYAGCVSGASTIDKINQQLKHAGFEQILIKPKKGSKEIIDSWDVSKTVSDYVISATIEAIKPE